MASRGKKVKVSVFILSFFYIYSYSALFVVPGYLTFKALGMDHTVLPAITPMHAFTL